MLNADETLASLGLSRVNTATLDLQGLVVTPAESALGSFARATRVRVSVCDHHNPNVAEPAFRQTTIRKAGLAIKIRAAATLIECETRLSDREIAFAVNQPDRVCLMNQAVDGLRGVLPWTMFVGDQRLNEPVTSWVKSTRHRRLLEAFDLRPRESVHAYLNGLCAIVEANRDLGIVVEALVALAEALPAVSTTVPNDCAQRLPSHLSPLARYFARWAVADDVERSERVSRSSKATRTRLRADVEPLLGAIDVYLTSLSEPLPDCALKLGLLAELVAELRHEV